jgi:hypothetical protein
LLNWLSRSPERPLQFLDWGNFRKALPLLPESLKFIGDADRWDTLAATESLKLLGDVPVAHWIV